MLEQLNERARANGAELPVQLNTPYVNTIRPEDEVPYPGDRAMERRIKSLIRWNAMAMVVRQNKYDAGIGGHISTYASLATLLEVGFNHFFHASYGDQPGDLIYFQGHASPGVYARAFLEGRLTEEHLKNFRHELREHAGPFLLSAPVADAGFLELPHGLDGPGADQRHLPGALHALPGESRHDPADAAPRLGFLGDGEMDEPESLGSLTLASREKLDNLIFVINCNLQRLDGPVRGNGKMIQELEAAFRGAGWNVIKVIWGERLGSAAGARHHRPAAKAHGRSGGRRVPDLRHQGRRLHPQELLRQVPRAARPGVAPERRRAVQAAAAAATIRSKVYNAYKAARRNQGPADR